MQAKFSKTLKLSKKKGKVNADYVRWLLIERGFNEFPESVKKVLDGGDEDTIAIMDEIKGDNTSTKVSERSNEEEDVSDGSEKKSKRRRSRFS